MTKKHWLSKLYMLLVAHWKPQWCDHVIIQAYGQSISCKSGAECAVHSVQYQWEKFTWCSGWEFRARISKKLNVDSTCCHRYSGQSQDFRPQCERKASHCTLTGEWGKQYLSGNLWRQEIETPCCEDLRKKRTKQTEWRLWQSSPHSHIPRGEKVVAGVSMVMRRGKWRGPFNIHLLIYCMSETYYSRWTYRLRNDGIIITISQIRDAIWLAWH